MSRLISRIRYRQFGIMMTTSYVDNQAYGEVVEDGHPILIVTASDIAGILRRNSISTSNIDCYLKFVDEENEFYIERSNGRSYATELLAIAEEKMTYR